MPQPTAPVALHAVGTAIPVAAAAVPMEGFQGQTFGRPVALGELPTCRSCGECAGLVITTITTAAVPAQQLLCGPWSGSVRALTVRLEWQCAGPDGASSREQGHSSKDRRMSTRLLRSGSGAGGVMMGKRWQQIASTRVWYHEGLDTDRWPALEGRGGQVRQ